MAPFKCTKRERMYLNLVEFVTKVHRCFLEHSLTRRMKTALAAGFRDLPE